MGRTEFSHHYAWFDRLHHYRYQIGRLQWCIANNLSLNVSPFPLHLRWDWIHHYYQGTLSLDTRVALNVNKILFCNFNILLSHVLLMLFFSKEQTNRSKCLNIFWYCFLEVCRDILDGAGRAQTVSARIKGHWRGVDPGALPCLAHGHDQSDRGSLIMTSS